MRPLFFITATIFFSSCFNAKAGDKNEQINRIKEAPADKLFSDLSQVVTLANISTISLRGADQVSQVMNQASVVLQLGIAKQNEEIIKQNKEIIALLQKIAEK